MLDRADLARSPMPAMESLDLAAKSLQEAQDEDSRRRALAAIAHEIDILLRAERARRPG